MYPPLEIESTLTAVELDRTRLQEFNRTLIKLLGHELGTPLTAILGYLRLWQEQGAIACREELDVVVEQARTLQVHLDDLLLLDQLEVGLGDLKPVPVHINEVVPRIARKFTRQFFEKNLKLHLDLDCRWLVYADEELFARALEHLISNALKFSRPGGSITISAQVQKGLCTISVADEGIGIPSERQTEIFEPFHQLDSSHSRRYPGLGIGLKLVRAIIEKHGGQVAVQSSSGKGSTFSISMPLL